LSLYYVILHKYGVVTLLGNHEAWMLRSLRDPTCHIWILALQSFATIRSYSTEAAAVVDREIERPGWYVVLVTLAGMEISRLADQVPTTSGP
jgi:hypothetical protein